MMANQRASLFGTLIVAVRWCSDRLIFVQRALWALNASPRTLPSCGLSYGLVRLITERQTLQAPSQAGLPAHVDEWVLRAHHLTIECSAGSPSMRMMYALYRIKMIALFVLY